MQFYALYLYKKLMLSISFLLYESNRDGSNNLKPNANVWRCMNNNNYRISFLTLGKGSNFFLLCIPPASITLGNNGRG